MNQTDGNSRPTLRSGGSSAGGGISFSGIVFFILFLAFTATLLIAAGVMWLADALDSIPLACLIGGGATAVISLCIYFFSVRSSAAVMREYADTVYETSRMAKAGYEQVKAWLSLIFE